MIIKRDHVSTYYTGNRVLLVLDLHEKEIERGGGGREG